MVVKLLLKGKSSVPRPPFVDKTRPLSRAQATANRQSGFGDEKTS